MRSQLRGTRYSWENLKFIFRAMKGIFCLGVSDERVYGTVRFPLWGKGATETLKGLRIRGGESEVYPFSIDTGGSKKTRGELSFQTEFFRDIQLFRESYKRIYG